VEDAVPLFEYECRKCGHQFEALVTMSRTPACPKCQSQDLEKRVSAAALAGVSGSSSSRPAGECRASGGCRPSGGG
jgi:putative FmdB family regulatory protein